MILPKVSNAWFFGTFLFLVLAATVGGFVWHPKSDYEVQAEIQAEAEFREKVRTGSWSFGYQGFEVTAETILLREGWATDRRFQDRENWTWQSDEWQRSSANGQQHIYPSESDSGSATSRSVEVTSLNVDQAYMHDLEGRVKSVLAGTVAR